MDSSVLLIKGAVVEVSSRLVVSEELELYRLSIPNQWLRGSLGRVRKELVTAGMRRRMAATTHFVGVPGNPQGCILKQGRHSLKSRSSNPFPGISGD